MREILADTLFDIDAILDILLAIAMVITLIGCASTSSEPQMQAEYHPSWPTPYEVCDVNWKVIEYKDAPYVALSFDDNLELATCSIDLIRYIKEINTKFCHYRPEGDSRCARYKE